MINPKYISYRNPKILKFAKGQPCQHCGVEDGTTVAAHQNGLESGRGSGMKGDDFRVSYLCYKCHGDYDSKRGDFAKDTDREINFYRAMMKTQKLWITELF